MTTTRRATLVALAIALVVSLAACEYPAGTRYVHEVFTEVDVVKDIVYRQTTTSTGAPIDLKLDIYRPRGDTATVRPAIMWMYGGSWVSGNKSNMAPYASDSARRGYVGVSLQYRIRPGGGPYLDLALDAYDDSIAGVQWLQANAATYGIDPDAVIVAGYSAGAYNALNVLYFPGRRGPAKTPAAGAIAIAGSAMAAPTPNRPPSIMFHGTADQTVAYASPQALCQSSNNAGNLCTLVTYEGAGHEIGTTESADIRTKSSRFAFDKILVPLGYRARTVT